MIGFYNYTMALTYLSLISAGWGIFVSLSGEGHPYYGALFLLLSGLCDAFDGKVARTKKDRSPLECNFGIQVDSLADLVAFGVLPACIGAAMLRRSEVMEAMGRCLGSTWQNVIHGLLLAILVLYMLAALIRLAYFNVIEEERQKTEGGVRKFYTGLPVTSASLIFPVILLLQFIIPADITLTYFVCICVVGFAFLSKIQVRKPGLKGILIMVAIGAVEFILLVVGKILIHHG